jgi:hypothetical protein
MVKGEAQQCHQQVIDAGWVGFDVPGDPPSSGSS